MSFRLLVFLLLSTVFLSASPVPEQNSTVVQPVKSDEKNVTRITSVVQEKRERDGHIQSILKKKKLLEKELLENNIWSKIYSNYHVYQELKKEEEALNGKINELNRIYERTDKEENALELAINQRDILRGKLALLKEYESNPFQKFLKPPEIGETPTVGNPFAVISAVNNFTAFADYGIDHSVNQTFIVFVNPFDKEVVRNFNFQSVVFESERFYRNKPRIISNKR